MVHLNYFLGKGLSGESNFIVSISCKNQSVILDEVCSVTLKYYLNCFMCVFDQIVRQFNATFKSPFILTITNSTLGYGWTYLDLLDRKKKEYYFRCYFSCDVSGKIDVTLNIKTDNNITTQTNAFQTLANVTDNLELNLYTIGKCRNITGTYVWLSWFLK